MSPRRHISNTPPELTSPTEDAASASVARVTYRRRPPGAAVGASTLYTRIDPAAADVAETLARRLGVSKAEFIQTLLFHVADTLTDEGVPAWWPKPIPSPEELDLQTA